MRELQDYIDAQNGGPGKGLFRIVTDPFEARRVDQRRQARRGHGHRGLRALRLRRPRRAARVHAPTQIDRAARRGLRPRRARHGARQQVRQRARAAWRATAARRAWSSTSATGSRPASFWQMGPARRATTTTRTAAADGAGRAGPRRSSPATSCDALLPPGTAPLYARAAALQRARPDPARRAPGQADDGAGDGHRPRPPQREARQQLLDVVEKAAATPASSRATAGARRTRSRASPRSAAS